MSGYFTTWVVQFRVQPSTPWTAPEDAYFSTFEEAQQELARLTKEAEEAAALVAIGGEKLEYRIRERGFI